MWQVHVVQHPNVAYAVDEHTLFDEERRENDAVHHRGAHHGTWVALAVLADAQKVPTREGSEEKSKICLSNHQYHHHHLHRGQLTCTRRAAQKSAPDNYSALA